MSTEPVRNDQRVSPRNPCPVCGHSGWCMFSADGRFVFCQRAELWGSERAIRETPAGWMFALDGEGRAAPERSPAAPIAPARAPLGHETLDGVYRRLATLCGLDDHAREDIIVRRCFPTALETGLYFSIPRPARANEIGEELQGEFGIDTLSRTPGFAVTCRTCDGRGTKLERPCEGCGGLGRTAPRVRSVRGDRHDYAAMGIDANGLAFWGAVRRLPFDPLRDEAKYMLLSSSRGADATLSGLPKYHVAGRAYPSHQCWITEGILKAEIAAYHLRKRVIGLASTSVDEPTMVEILRLGREWHGSCS